MDDVFVQGDQMLRALRFMDSMIQRDTMQKMAFLNDLTTFWDKFDDRILRLKVTALEPCLVTTLPKALPSADHCLLIRCS